MARIGTNFFSDINERYLNHKPIPPRSNPRVFISHQKKDSKEAEVVANYLLNAGIDIYFDQYDKSIDRSEPYSVVNAIKRGIENSSHMLVLFSPNTFESMWVPWEIGYAYNSPVALNVLRLKGVAKEKLPEYLKVVKVILDIWDLNQLISNLTNITREQLLTEGRIKKYSDIIHPLRQYMDSI